MMTSFQPACILQHGRLESMLQGAEMLAGAIMQEDSSFFQIPEPDPIRPDGAIEVVPYLPLSYGDIWKQLENFKDLFCSSRDETIIGCSSSLMPLPVESSYGIGNASFCKNILRKCSNVESKSCGSGDAENIATSTGTMSHSCRSAMERFKSSPSEKKEVHPSRQNFQDNQWEVKYLELTDFHQKHGHLNVPHTGSNQQVGEIRNTW